MRATMMEIGPLLLSRMLDLNDVQEGLINIAFRYADEDPELTGVDSNGLVDLKDLRKLLSYIGEHAKEISAQVRQRGRGEHRCGAAPAYWCWKTRARQVSPANRP